MLSAIDIKLISIREMRSSTKSTDIGKIKRQVLNLGKHVLYIQKREDYKHEYDRLRGAMLAGLVRESSKKIYLQTNGQIKRFGKRIHSR